MNTVSETYSSLQICSLKTFGLLTHDEITLCSHSSMFSNCPNPDPSSGKHKPFVTSDSWRWFRIGDVNAGLFSGLG